MKLACLFGGLSFQAKTVLGILLIEVALLGLLVGWSLEYLATTKTRGTAEKAHTTATLFATMARDAVLSDDLASLESFADAVMAEADVLALRVIGQGDRVLVDRGRWDHPELEWAASRIQEAGIGFGEIQVGLSTAAKQGLLAEARERLLGLALLEMGLVALLSLLLGNYLTRGLRQLQAAALRISSDSLTSGAQFHPVPVLGKDELAATALAFNRMAAGLQEGYEALRQAREEAEQAAAEARAASKEAERANAAKSRFLAHMSHELRTPLNAVIGTLDLARDWELPKPQLEQLQMADAAGHSLLELINNVLDLSKVEAGEMSLYPEPTPLAGLIERVAAVVGPLARAKGLDLEVNLDPQLPRVVAVDGLRLRQVLVNLAGNAVKFTDSGCVRVRVQALCSHQPCTRLSFAVEDTGRGIPLDQLDILFEEFSQVREGHHPGATGTGLGLAITRRLVVLLGGEIKVESHLGQGSRFSFDLTLDAIDWAGPEVGQPPSGPLPCRRTGPDAALPVLVVDDVATNLMVAQAALGRAGYRVVTAANGAQALAVICDQPIGAVLMDVSMPEMDGIEATRRIRALAPPAGRVPIIAMTAHAFGEEEARCREAGMDDFITKPFRLAGLLPVLEQWYGGRGGGEAV